MLFAKSLQKIKIILDSNGEKLLAAARPKVKNYLAEQVLTSLK